MGQVSGRRPGGRPRKFSEPSRAVTVTLPERVLSHLATISADRAQAITRVADEVRGKTFDSQSPACLVEVAPGEAVVLVANSVQLRRVPWLRLVEISPGRHLISLVPGTSLEKLEVAVSDLLESLPRSEQSEREVLESLYRTIRGPRQQQKLSRAEILIVELPDKAAAGAP